MKKTFILITLITFLFLSYTACLQFKEKDVSLNKQIIYEVDNLSQNYSTKIITHLELSEFIYLTIELNDTYNSNEFSLLNNDAVSLEDHRIRVNENYCATNNDFLNVYEIMFYDEISISLYAPFIQVKYLDYRNYLKDEKLYHTMLKSTVVKNIYLSDDKTYNYTTRNELHYLNNEITYYPFSNALNDVNVPSSKEYLGDNINIGILELGIPDSYTNFQSNNVYTLGTTQNSHTTAVMSIIGGSSGIASNSNLYSASCLDYSMYECINWFIENNVNVINMSAGVFNSTYTSISSFVDYIVKNTKISFIAASGNRSGEIGSDFMISSPSTALNVFSIGSYDDNKHISFFSGAWDDPYNGEIIKPTLVAPGGNLVGIQNINTPISGTSFSTPIVTGIVALLMDQYPALKNHPEQVMALLISSSTKLPTQINVWDSDAGFGSIDYGKAKETYENTGFYEISSNSPNSSLVKTVKINVPANKRAKITHFVLYNSQTSTIANDQNIEVPFIFTKYILKIYENDTLISTSSGDSNIISLEYDNISNSDKIIYLRIYLKGNKIGNNKEYASLSISGIEHIHDYIYTAIDDEYHLSECWCGSEIISKHNFVRNRTYLPTIMMAVTAPDFIPFYVCSVCGFVTMRPPLQ